MTGLSTKAFRTEILTRADHEDPTLRGRRYSIPYQRVWIEAMGLVTSWAPRWDLLEADDQNGRLRARSTSMLLRIAQEVEIRIYLDEDAQTRVDVTSRSRAGRWGFATQARAVRSFLVALDEQLRARAKQPAPLERVDPPIASPPNAPHLRSGTS